jgi:hypothetical protein
MTRPRSLADELAELVNPAPQGGEGRVVESLTSWLEHRT